VLRSADCKRFVTSGGELVFLQISAQQKPSGYGGLSCRCVLARSALLSPRKRALLAEDKPCGSI